MKRGKITRRGREFWSDLIKEQRESGLSVANFAVTKVLSKVRFMLGASGLDL